MNNYVTVQGSFAPALLLLAIAPYCFTRILLPRLKFSATMLIAAIITALLNIVIPVILHLAKQPITQVSLLKIHILLTVISYIWFRLRKIPLLPQAQQTDKYLLGIIAVFAVMVIPFTPLTGIDTYKWLDLAKTMRVEHDVSWLVHPLSLFGFTGRSYPNAQPLILGSIMTISNLGVEWSFYFMSLLSGAIGILSAFFLIRKCFHNRFIAVWGAGFYGFSPVFMRYNHWATGRGLFLALFPLFLLALINLFSGIPPGQKRIKYIFLNLCGILLFGFLLPLSHKVGMITLILIFASLIPAVILPRKKFSFLIILFFIPAAIIAMAISPRIILPTPAGQVAGCLYMSLSRFGWLLPLAVAGILLPGNWFTNRRLRILFPAMLMSIAISCARDMYGALIALIFVTIAAVNGFFWFLRKFPAYRREIKFVTSIFIIAGALVIVINRSAHATPRRIRDAALFLNSYDPYGPFMITSDRWRTKIQGYTTGCPRFNLVKSKNFKVNFHHPPSFKGSPAQILANWTTYTRNIIGISGLRVYYYGKNPRHYFLRIDKNTSIPKGTTCIYKKNGVEILKPSGQHLPQEVIDIKQSVSLPDNKR